MGTTRVRWTIMVVVLLALILIPFAVWGEAMDQWVFSRLDVSGSPWLAVLVAGLLAGDVMLPVPSSVLSTASGALFGFVPGTLVSAAGMTIGCSFAYLLGAGLGRPAARRWVDVDGLGQVEGLWTRYGDGALVLARAVPVLAEASTVLAGVGRVPLGRFFVLVTLSNVGISLAYAAVGAYASDVESFLLAFAGAVILPGVAMAIARFGEPRTRASGATGAPPVRRPR